MRCRSLISLNGSKYYWRNPSAFLAFSKNRVVLNRSKGFPVVDPENHPLHLKASIAHTTTMWTSQKHMFHVLPSGHNGRISTRLGIFGDANRINRAKFQVDQWRGWIFMGSKKYFHCEKRNRSQQCIALHCSANMWLRGRVHLATHRTLMKQFQ